MYLIETMFMANSNIILHSGGSIMLEIVLGL